jgi:nitrate reductase NapE component
VAVLALFVVLTFVMDPLLGLALVGMFGVAALMQRSDARR